MVRPVDAGVADDLAVEDQLHRAHARRRLVVAHPRVGDGLAVRAPQLALQVLAARALRGDADVGDDAAVLDGHAVRPGDARVGGHEVELRVRDAVLALDHAVEHHAPVAAVLHGDAFGDGQVGDEHAVAAIDEGEREFGARPQAGDGARGDRVQRRRAVLAVSDGEDADRLVDAVVEPLGPELDAGLVVTRAGGARVRGLGLVVAHVLRQRRRPQRILDPGLHVLERLLRDGGLAPVEVAVVGALGVDLLRLRRRRVVRVLGRAFAVRRRGAHLGQGRRRLRARAQQEHEERRGSDGDDDGDAAIARARGAQLRGTLLH